MAVGLCVLVGQAVDERDPQVFDLRCKPWYDGVRSDPRFTAQLRKMGVAA
jgi:hypothetical protein